MAYVDLSVEQKASLDAWMTLLRASVGELARVNNHLDVVNIECNASAGGKWKRRLVIWKG